MSRRTWAPGRSIKSTAAYARCRASSSESPTAVTPVVPLVHRLGLRLAEADVELEDFRTGRGHHQARVQQPAEAAPLFDQAARGRLEHLAHRARDRQIVEHRRR